MVPLVAVRGAGSSMGPSSPEVRAPRPFKTFKNRGRHVEDARCQHTYSTRTPIADLGDTRLRHAGVCHWHR